MRVFDPVKDGLAFVRKLTPSQVRQLARASITDIVSRELPRSRARVAQLESRYPSAGAKELAQRLIDEKKQLAGMVGGVSGFFGLFGIPADLVGMLYLEVVLLTDIATLYKANLKAASARTELLDLLGDSHGVSAWTRATPRTLGTFAGIVLSRTGFKTWGRAIPGASAVVSAWLNNHHMQETGEAAVRHYEGFGKAHKKTRDTAG